MDKETRVETSDKGAHAAASPDEDASDQPRLRVLYGLMLPVARLGFLFGTSLKTAGELMQMAAFHETRRRGLSTREIADRLSVSPRKVALLSRQLKQNFMHSEKAHELPRQIEFMLWAGPLSAARVKQAMGDVEAADVDLALAALLDKGRIRHIPGRTDRYEVVRTEYRLVSPDWLARIDGLQNLMGSVANVVYARFFRAESQAFARTVNLRIRDADIDELRRLYEETLWPALVALDDAARGCDDAHDIDVSVLWGPNEYTQRFSHHSDAGDTQ